MDVWIIIEFISLIYTFFHAQKTFTSPSDISYAP